MVWGAFAGTVKAPLLVWDRDSWGTVTKTSFLQHVYPIIRSFYGTYNAYLRQVLTPEELGFNSSPAIFQQDNAPVHAAHDVQLQLQNDNITTLRWPANSPDLNLIEAVWNKMKHRINRRPQRPTSREAMAAAVLEEWDAITEDELHELIETMPLRILDVINANGGYTGW
ncbi:Transposable element tc1 transposase [Pyrenophora teres f. maculata]|nr:Transposable element tc1 transposase [Pyrenophora teres f. maculata]